MSAFTCLHTYCTCLKTCLTLLAGKMDGIFSSFRELFFCHKEANPLLLICLMVLVVKQKKIYFWEDRG